MSDYMFMLESHLSADQSGLVSLVQRFAQQAGLTCFLTGGAMRDMLGGFPVRDLDFTVEGPALKLARRLAEAADATVVWADDHRKSAEMLFPGGIRASLSMARQERYGKPGARPQITPATIHEDLRCRDFTVNAIALSLNPASRGLLLDPNNGIADLARKELRAVGSYAFYDDPSRMLRLLRFRVRLGFDVEARTRSQYENARLAGMEKRISSRALLAELREIARELRPGELVRLLDEENLLKIYSPALSGPKLNAAAFVKLEKARQMAPFGVDLHLEELGLFLHLLTEKLTPKERAELARLLELPKAELDQWQKLESRARKLEKVLQSPKLAKASQLYHALREAPGDQVFFLLLRSEQRVVQERIRNYLQKHLAAAQEVTDREVAAAGAPPGSPRYQKTKEEMISARLDARAQKPAPPPLEPVPEPPSGRPSGGPFTRSK